MLTHAFIFCIFFVDTLETEQMLECGDDRSTGQLKYHYHKERVSLVVSHIIALGYVAIGMGCCRWA